MLDDYIKSQNIAHKIISNQIKRNMISHAYIIETNGNIEGFNFAKAFAKTLLCPNRYLNLNNCSNCDQCHIIDQDNFIELKIINPDGMWITKNQIEELQNTFLKKALIGKYKVYIINHAEKMKSNIMDSLLKFIEEPLDGIIAILITENINNLIETIVSRCQIISLKKSNTITIMGDTVEKIKTLIDTKKYETIENKHDLLNKVLEFIKYYEHNGVETLIYTKELWHDNFYENIGVNYALEIMLLFYKEVLDYKINGQVIIFSEYKSIIELVDKRNSIPQLSDKINVIMDISKRLKYNANLILLIDKLIIELEKRCKND